PFPVRRKGSPMSHAEVDSNGDVALFQYGSNMSCERLQSKVNAHRLKFAPPGTREEIRYLGRGRLSGWRFTLDLYSAGQDCLVADIIAGSAEDQVWGVVYKLDRELVDRTNGQRSVLDRIEGHRPTSNPENYRPRIVRLELGGAVVSAITYVGTEDARRRCREEHYGIRVSSRYAAAVLGGAAGANLPS